MYGESEITKYFLCFADLFHILSKNVNILPDKKILISGIGMIGGSHEYNDKDIFCFNRNYHNSSFVLT